MAGERQFDLVVIGGGPAGEKAAAQAAYWGKRVALVERRDLLGGTMTGGVVSSKTMREAALYLTGFQSRPVYDIALDLDATTAMGRLRTRTDDVVAAASARVADNLTRHGVELVRGTGRLGPSRTVVVEDAGGATSPLQGDVVLLAPGSRALRPPGVPFDHPRVLDADDAARLDSPLSSVTVVGGGAVGCEFASIFLALGADVTLVDSGPRLLPFMDAEISALLADTFRASGMRVIQDGGRAGVETAGEAVAIVLQGGERIESETVVFATGRTGNTDGLLLGGCGVEVDGRNRIVVDEVFATSAPGVYAAGDVVGPPALASVSMEQARIAMCHAFDLPLKRSLAETATYGVYAIPEVAMVGLTEHAARELGHDVAVGRAALADNTRARIGGTTAGLVKLVVARDSLRIVGVHVLGQSATELIHIGAAALHFGATLDYFVQATFNVPTLSEAFKYAAYDALGDVGR